MRKLTFFTHTIDGKLYGGWYRLEAPTDIEVQAVGFLQRVSWHGSTPEGAARQCLEEFVRQRANAGEAKPPLRSLGSITNTESLAPRSSNGASTRSRPTKQ